MHRQIGTLLRRDRATCTEWVGTLIESELMRGNVQEAFRHLRGWYQAALEMQAKPCYHTMEHQTSERVDLYVRRLPQGDHLPINVDRIEINDDAPLDMEKQTAISKLSNGHAAGAFRMRAKHVKEWLQGILWEEDIYYYCPFWYPVP
jgi:hypothetical protein